MFRSVSSSSFCNYRSEIGASEQPCHRKWQQTVVGEASQSHGFDSPCRGEGRDSPNNPAIREGLWKGRCIRICRSLIPKGMRIMWWVS